MQENFYSCPSVTDAADIQQRWFVTPLVIILCPISSTHNESHAPQLLTLGLEPPKLTFSFSDLMFFSTENTCALPGQKVKQNVIVDPPTNDQKKLSSYFQPLETLDEAI